MELQQPMKLINNLAATVEFSSGYQCRSGKTSQSELAVVV